MDSEIQKLVNALVAAVRKQVTAELDAKLASDCKAIASGLERLMGAKVAPPTKYAAKPAKKAKASKSSKKDGRKGGKLCYFTGCKNGAAPRFGMFCVALHKDLSKAEKAKYKAIHNGDSLSPAKAAKKSKRAPKPAAKVKAKAHGSKNAVDKKSETTASA